MRLRRQRVRDEKLQAGKILTDRHKVSNLIALLDIERDTVSELKDSLRTQMRKKQAPQVKALELALEAVSELRYITHNLISSGSLPFRLKFAPSLSGSNHNIYSGFVCQLEHETVRKSKQVNRSRLSIVAVGGRYDDLVSQFQVNVEPEEDVDGNVTKVGVVGLSIEIEKLIRYVIDDEKSSNFNQANAVDVAICCVTSSSSPEKWQQIFKEMCFISRELRSHGVRVACFPEDTFRSVDDINKFCYESLVKFAVILKETHDVIDPRNCIHVKLISYDKERFVEKKSGKLPSSEIVDYLKSLLTCSKIEGMTGVCNDSNVVKSESNKSVSWAMTGDNATNNSASSLAASTNIHFLPLENKLITVARKRYQNQIISLLSSAFSGTSGSSTIEVVALEVTYKIVRSIASEIEFSEDPSELKKHREAGVACLAEKHPRFRKYIGDVLDLVYAIKAENKSALISLFSFTEIKFIILS